jgi:cytochrome c oxidase cbb3-type subunit III
LRSKFLPTITMQKIAREISPGYEPSFERSCGDDTKSLPSLRDLITRSTDTQDSRPGLLSFVPSGLLVVGLIFSMGLAFAGSALGQDVRGRGAFLANCAMCHGSEAKGGSGPNLIESSLVRHDEDGSAISKTIREGRSERGMPAFPGLPAETVNDLAAYLHASIIAADRRSAEGGPAGGYSRQRLLTGNVAAGQRYFAGACSSCHSPTGDLKGVAKKYSPVELEGRLLYPEPAKKTGTVTVAGQKVSGEILHLDAFSVSLRDAAGKYYSWPLGPGVAVEVADPLRGHRELLRKYKDSDIHDVFAYLETLS